MFLLDAFDDGDNGQPGPVLDADDDGEDLFVQFNQFVVAVASDDRQQDGVLDGLLLRLVHLLLLRRPVQLYVVLQLHQRRLLHLDLQSRLVHDLHQTHRKTCIRVYLPTLVAASARKEAVYLRVLESPMKVLRRAATKVYFEGRLVISTNYFTN